MHFAQRVQQLPPYLFAEISRKIAAKRAQGVEVISFGIGDPDLPTPPHVIDALKRAAEVPANHRYPESDGLPELREAINEWYGRRFGVTFNPAKEILPLIGSKEGIGHVSLCFIDPGDIALIPDPGYPVYAAGTLFAGGQAYELPLEEESGWLPDLEAIPADVAHRARVIWINYPNNPTGAIADVAFFERVISFARKYDVMVLHDLAYSDVTFDGYQPPSFMQVPGAIDVGIEFNSLSKTYNMTGWRIGMAVGNPDMIDALARVKSNLDSGIPQAIQQMGIAAIRGPQDAVAEHNVIYQRRRDRVVQALRDLGLRCSAPKASLYIWAKIPEGETSIGFAGRLLDDTGVVVTPGVGYGSQGEGYVRLSLTTPDEDVDEGLRRLAAWRSQAISA
ncbi:MAG TPA: LL-diaminopimelate aminotransferase [Dehalococcoidia bacterium]